MVVRSPCAAFTPALGGNFCKPGQRRFQGGINGFGHGMAVLLDQGQPCMQAGIFQPERSVGRTHHVIPALDDFHRNAGKATCIADQLVRLKKTAIGKILRFYKRMRSHKFRTARSKALPDFFGRGVEPEDSARRLRSGIPESISSCIASRTEAKKARTFN